MKAKSAWAPAKAVSAISGVVTGGFAEASSQASDPLSGQIQSKPCSTYTHMPLFRASARLRYMHTSDEPMNSKYQKGKSVRETTYVSVQYESACSACTGWTCIVLLSRQTITCDGYVCRRERLLLSTVASASGPTACGLQLQRPSSPPLKPQP